MFGSVKPTSKRRGRLSISMVKQDLAIRRDIAVTNGGGLRETIAKANQSLKEMSLPFFHLGIPFHKSK